MSQKPIESKWLSYTDQIFDQVEVSTTQYSETRLAFYAGAHAAIESLLSALDEKETLAVTRIGEIREEVYEFLKDRLGIDVRRES